MSEDWKKKADNLPHYEPAHVTQNKSLDDILNNVPGLPPGPTAQPRQSQMVPPSQVKPSDGGWGSEMDMSRAFSSMIPTDPEAIKAHMMQKMAAQGQLPQQPKNIAPVADTDTAVYIKEGCQSFKQVQAETAIPLATHMGPAANVVGKEFRMCGIKKYYVVEGQEPIDLANPDYSKMKQLVAVEAPWIGTILVEQSSIIKTGASGRTILKG